MTFSSRKKVFASLLFHESNTFNPVATTYQDFMRFSGSAALKRMGSTSVLEDSGIDVVGGSWAMALSSGPVAPSCFIQLQNEIRSELEKFNDLDGVLLHLHGSMQVADGSSGDLRIISMFREILGQEIPIVLAMDPHANLSIELTNQVDGICAYNTIPHIDQEGTERRAAHLLLQRMDLGERVAPTVVKLPLVIGGDSAIDTMEPMQEIHAEILQAISGAKTLDANFFVGFSWSDNKNLGSSVVLNPTTLQNREDCMKLARKIGGTVWKNRAEFTYSEQTFDIAAGMRWAQQSEGPVVLADTGDNTTGGAPGWGTAVLAEILQNRDLLDGNKHICLGPIRDNSAFDVVCQSMIGDEVQFQIGDDSGPDRPSVEVVGTLLAKGALLGYLGSVNEVVGQTVTVRIDNLDVVIANHPSSFVTENHFRAAGLNPDQYGLVIVKQGYIFPEIKDEWSASAFLLTPGSTNQHFTDLPFEHRPKDLYPFDPNVTWNPSQASLE